MFYYGEHTAWPGAQSQKHKSEVQSMELRPKVMWRGLQKNESDANIH